MAMCGAPPSPRSRHLGPPVTTTAPTICTAASAASFSFPRTRSPVIIRACDRQTPPPASQTTWPPAAELPLPFIAITASIWHLSIFVGTSSLPPVFIPDRIRAALAGLATPSSFVNAGPVHCSRRPFPPFGTIAAHGDYAAKLAIALSNTRTGMPRKLRVLLSKTACPALGLPTWPGLLYG